jgi:hypothetical protein
MRGKSPPCLQPASRSSGTPPLRGFHPRNAPGPPATRTLSSSFGTASIDKPFHKAWCPDPAIEQARLFRIASLQKSRVYSLPRQDNNNEDAKKIGLTHLIGKAKYDTEIADRVKSILRQLAPGVYEACAEREKSLGY